MKKPKFLRNRRTIPQESRESYPAHIPPIRGGIESIARGVADGFGGFGKRLNLRDMVEVDPVIVGRQDTEALGGDWETVGYDLQTAMNNFEQGKEE